MSHILCFQFAVVRIRSNSNLGQGTAIFSVNDLKFRVRKIWLITDFVYWSPSARNTETYSGRWTQSSLRSHCVQRWGSATRLSVVENKTNRAFINRPHGMLFVEPYTNRLAEEKRGLVHLFGSVKIVPTA